MSGGLLVRINGADRVLEGQGPELTLAETLSALGIKPDRVAIEHNGTIAPRDRWSSHVVREGDRLEIVHFVGGG